jgi:hypothetical protein
MIRYNYLTCAKKFTYLGQYTLSMITSQLHCFQPNAILNGRISSFFLMSYAQKSRTSFFNTCAKKTFRFWSINMEISINTKTRSCDVIIERVYCCMVCFETCLKHVWLDKSLNLILKHDITVKYEINNHNCEDKG